MRFTPGISYCSSVNYTVKVHENPTPTPTARRALVPKDLFFFFANFVNR